MVSLHERALPDVFIHHSGIQGEGFTNLDEGERVEFLVEQTPRGLQATDIVRL